MSEFIVIKPHMDGWLWEVQHRGLCRVAFCVDIEDAWSEACEAWDDLERAGDAKAAEGRVALLDNDEHWAEMRERWQGKEKEHETP